MIAVQEVIDTYVGALAADAAIETWCQAEYGKSATIFVGIDTRNPPGKAQVPFIVFRPGPSAEGDEVGTFQYTFTVDWIIVNEGSTTTGGVVKMDGLKKSDEFGQLILAALRGASQNAVLSSWTYYIEPVEFWPMYAGNMEITLNVPHLIGGAVSL